MAEDAEAIADALGVTAEQRFGPNPDDRVDITVVVGPDLLDAYGLAPRHRQPGTTTRETTLADIDDTTQLGRHAARAADDKQGEDTLVLEVGAVLAVTEHFVITHGRNPRQVRTIAEEVEQQVGTERAGRSRCASRASTTSPGCSSTTATSSSTSSRRRPAASTSSNGSGRRAPHRLAGLKQA